MACIFGIGYFMGTVGALGIGFAVAEYEPRIEKWYDDCIIYKETPLGNALSDYRGKKVEVFKTISWFPIIEWRINKKEYFNILVYLTPLTVDYKATEKKIYLSASREWGKDRHIETWSDTLVLGR